MKESVYEADFPLRVALLSDLHERDFGFLGQVCKRQPDLIALAGDIFTGGPDPGGNSAERMEPFFKACTEIAPTFFALGNHEWILTEEDLSRIRDLGVTVLDDSFTDFRGIRIGALTSGMVHRARALSAQQKGSLSGEALYGAVREKEDLPDLSWLSDFERGGGKKLLLCHQPEYYPLYLRERSIDLILSGHAHGGQIRFFDPVGRRFRGLFAPGQGFFPALTEGQIESRLIISRGLSNTARCIPRLFNPRELVFVQGKPAQKAGEPGPCRELYSRPGDCEKFINDTKKK